MNTQRMVINGHAGTLQAALELARDQFRVIAQQMEDQGQWRLADQFKLQAEQTEAMRQQLPI